jgi:hypothetical protein
MITRKQIKQALDEAYTARYGGEEEGEALEFAQAIDDWFESGEYPFWVLESLFDAIVRLSGKPPCALGWYAEPVCDELGYSGHIIFVLVDAESGRCLTLSHPKSPDEHASVSVSLPITTEEEAVDAVAYFLQLLGVQVASSLVPTNAS